METQLSSTEAADVKTHVASTIPSQGPAVAATLTYFEQLESWAFGVPKTAKLNTLSGLPIHDGCSYAVL